LQAVAKDRVANPLPHHMGETNEPRANQVALVGVLRKPEAGKARASVALNTACGPAPKWRAQAGERVRRCGCGRSPHNSSCIGVSGRYVVR